MCWIVGTSWSVAAALLACLQHLNYCSISLLPHNTTLTVHSSCRVMSVVPFSTSKRWGPVAVWPRTICGMTEDQLWFNYKQMLWPTVHSLCVYVGYWYILHFLINISLSSLQFTWLVIPYSLHSSRNLSIPCKPCPSFMQLALLLLLLLLKSLIQVDRPYSQYSTRTVDYSDILCSPSS